MQQHLEPALPAGDGGDPEGVALDADRCRGDQVEIDAVADDGEALGERRRLCPKLLRLPLADE